MSAPSIVTYFSNVSLVNEIFSLIKLIDLKLVLGDFKISAITWVFNDHLGYFIPINFLPTYDDLFEGMNDLL